MSVVRCVRFRVAVLVRARDLEAFYVFRGDVNIESRRGRGADVYVCHRCVGRREMAVGGAGTEVRDWW